MDMDSTSEPEVDMEVEAAFQTPSLTSGDIEVDSDRETAVCVPLNTDLDKYTQEPDYPSFHEEELPHEGKFASQF